MMCVADKFVIICLDSIDNQQEREHVIKIITDSKKEIIDSTYLFTNNLGIPLKSTQESLPLFISNSYPSRFS